MSKSVSRNKVQKALREVRNSVRTIALLHATLGAIIFFFAGLLIMQLVALRWYWAFAVASPFIIWVYYRNLSNANLYLVENTVTEFKDVLTTLRDSMHLNNEVVRELQRETIIKLKHIKNSYFLRFGGITVKLLSIVVLSVTIVSLAAFNIQFVAFTDIVDAVSDIRPFQEYALDESLLDYEENETDEIYGNKSVAELGLEELQLKINPLESDIDISDIKEAEKREFATERAAREIIAANDASYSENIPKEYRKIVKFYFNEITKS
jgi:hypothetical protein